jgi:hypothetical protein
VYLLRTDSWYVERLVLVIAGCVNSASIILVLAHSLYWLILTGFVSVNLLVFSVTGFCPSAAVMDRAGVKSLLKKKGE